MRLPTLLLLLPLTLARADSKLTIEAGDFDRQQTIVTFKGGLLPPGDYALRDGDAAIPIQFTNGQGIFIEPALKKGERKTYTVEKIEKPAARVQVKTEGDVLKVLHDGKPLFHYQAKPGPVPGGVPEHFRHGAHLHPVFTPVGRIVTGNHPADHRWHRGIWFGWTDTDFEGRHPDFWNMGKEKSGALTGEVRFKALERYWSGPVQAFFEANHVWIDHTSGAEKEVLNETWQVAATPLPNANVFDLTSTQTTATQTPLKLPKYYYGGLGLRGNGAWDPADQVTMLTSEGLDRKTGDNSKARWVQMGGNVEGQPVSIAILIHPENFRFPQPLRLNPKNPQLCIAPSQEGDWSIEPGKPYISRYRFIVTDGAPDPALLERAWNDYASPPKVTLPESKR